MELQKLKALCNFPKPFIIEFSGTPRTGKTTTIHNLYDFFKKGGFKVSIVEEFWTSKYCKENFKSKIDKMSKADGTIAIVEEVCKQLLKESKKEQDILLLDRSINDRQIWNYRRYAHKDMSKERYLKERDKYAKISKELIDFLVVTHIDTLTCLKRDYHCNLSLEKEIF